MKLSQKIKESKYVKYLYNTLFYFELGKGTAGRFYLPILEFVNLLLLISIKYNFTLKLVDFAIYILIVLNILTILGLFMHKLGFYAADRFVQTNKDPVMKEIWDAAKKVNNENSLQKRKR